MTNTLQQPATPAGVPPTAPVTTPGPDIVPLPPTPHPDPEPMIDPVPPGISDPIPSGGAPPVGDPARG